MSGGAGDRRGWALLAPGLLWVGAELSAAALAPGPLDPGPLDPGAIGLSAAAALVQVGLLAALLRWIPAPWVAGGWAAVWGPEALRAALLPAGLGLLLAPLAALLAALLAARLPRRRSGLLLGLLIGALATPALRARGLGDGGAPAGPPTLLVTVDTARADAGLLEAAGLVGAPGWWTGAAIAGAPWTLPAMATLWTGLPPAAHGAGRPVPGGWTPLDPALPAFTDSLRGVAVLSNPHLRPDAGFGRGLGQIEHADLARHPLLLGQILGGWGHRLGAGPPGWACDRDARAVARAEGLLQEARAGLIWVHLLAPHEHARCPAPPAPGGPGSAVGSPAYAAQIHATAALLRRLVAAAGDRRVVVVADHGESFGEGGLQGHGTGLVAAQLRVPVALRIGGAGGALPGELAVADLTGVLRGGPPPGPAAAVDVGGLRAAWAHGRWSGGAVVPVEPPAPPGGPGVGGGAAGPLWAEALRALGYLDPG